MRHAIAPLTAALLLVACASTPSGPTASAQLQPTRGSTVSGNVTFVQQGDMVIVSGEVKGLKPNAEHGFHVHDKGDCSSGDGMSTGGHFNPMSAAHGGHHTSTHHVGDLPSLETNASGIARFYFETTSISIGTGAANIVGRGLIVHRDPDDFTTQPTGNAGPRLACAVISLPQRQAPASSSSSGY
jgi:superoxide dismutase, Cu-Zn family